MPSKYKSAINLSFFPHLFNILLHIANLSGEISLPCISWCDANVGCVSH